MIFFELAKKCSFVVLVWVIIVSIIYGSILGFISLLAVITRDPNRDPSEKERLAFNVFSLLCLICAALLFPFSWFIPFSLIPLTSSALGGVVFRRYLQWKKFRYRHLPTR